MASEEGWKKALETALESSIIKDKDIDLIQLEKDFSISENNEFWNNEQGWKSESIAKSHWENVKLALQTNHLRGK